MVRVRDQGATRERGPRFAREPRTHRLLRSTQSMPLGLQGGVANVAAAAAAAGAAAAAAATTTVAVRDVI